MGTMMTFYEVINLGFDLDLLGEKRLDKNEIVSIAEGTYRIEIQVLGDEGKIVARRSKELQKDHICRLFHGFDKTCDSPEYREIQEAGDK